MDLPPLSPREAATRLGVSEQRVRTLLRDKILSGQQIGKTWCVDPISIEQYLRKQSSQNPSDKRSNIAHTGVRALSFFSGAMGLDLGLEKAGIEIALACEVDKRCRQTILANRPDIALIGDITAYDPSEILDYAGIKAGEVDIIAGGPPCQAFSTAGSRRAFNDERGNVFLRYLDVILALRPRYAVIENVRGLLSAPLNHRPHAERGEHNAPLRADERPGGALAHIVQLLRAGGYSVSFNLYNAANYGVPQIRERVVIICSRDGSRVPYMNPTHSDNPEFGLPRWQTLQNAIGDLDSA
ncbi:MAG: DNA cytosine methyltransferase, partial [Alphaproteobacteria bacterium]|nr:DNA cytosine methyltransferase [Alphaproteobacteria bacterium]